MNCVQYMNHMGDDDTVCDAARVSMDKQADLFTVSQNERLINYLAKNKHWSPFAHCTLQLRFRAPILLPDNSPSIKLGLLGMKCLDVMLIVRQHFGCHIKTNLDLKLTTSNRGLHVSFLKDLMSLLKD